MPSEKDNSPNGSAEAPHPVFISYRRVDDRPPPDDLKAQGFVRYFWKQLDYELTQLGLPEGVLWLDRNKIEGGDDFTAVIADELARSNIFVAILSRNYIQGGWCTAELEAFAKRMEQMESEARKKRIFRVDKQSVQDDSIPPALRNLHAIQFFERDEETGGDLEFYHRGKVLRKKPYMAAVRELAELIFRRLQEIGMSHVEPREQRKPSLVKSNGRTIYVARPGAELRDPYETLVQELQGRGYTVVPDPGKELPGDGRAAVETVRSALAQAEASIHLIGERRGFKPDGMDDGIVPLQLVEAGRMVASQKNFERLIWAPKILPGTDEKTAPRDPLAVVERFDAPLPSDQVDSDTGARFNEFVLQRLNSRATPVAAPRKRMVYVGCLPLDQKLGLDVARQVKELGASPILAPVGHAEQAFFCWGEADEASILDALDSPSIRNWRTAKPKGRLIVVACPPHSPTKAAACELGEFGPADAVIDGTTGDLRGKLATYLSTSQ